MIGQMPKFTASSPKSRFFFRHSGPYPAGAACITDVALENPGIASNPKRKRDLCIRRCFRGQHLAKERSMPELGYKRPGSPKTERGLLRRSRPYSPSLSHLLIRHDGESPNTTIGILPDIFPLLYKYRSQTSQTQV
jgi:hypothetical protein